MSDSIKKLLKKYQVGTSGKYISEEFQDYAYRLAMDLSGPEDRSTISMCMRLVKTKPRAILEQAQSYIKDANARNKIALFLWKIKDLEKQKADSKKSKDQAEDSEAKNIGSQPKLLP